MQRDLSLKVNEDDAWVVESIFRHLEELLQTLQGVGGSQDVTEEHPGMIRPTVDGNGDQMTLHIWQELITILVIYLIKRKVKCPSIRSDWILKTK